MASTNSPQAKASARAIRASISETLRQGLRERVAAIIKGHFPNTLAKLSPAGLPHVVNLVMALIYKESGFNPEIPGPQYNIHAKGTEAYRYANSSVIKPLLQTTGIQRLNAEDAARAFGLMQVNGYYAIKGTFEGKGELMRMRPDIAGPLMINPGDSVRAKLLGYGNMDNQILAGLIVLEEKMRIAGKLAGNSPNSSKLALTFAGYLGFGKKDQLGTTPEAYAKSILEGDAYAKANGTDPIYVAQTPSTKEASQGPVKTAASGKTLSVAGCA